MFDLGVRKGPIIGMTSKTNIWKKRRALARRSKIVIGGQVLDIFRRM